MMRRLLIAIAAVAVLCAPGFVRRADAFAFAPDGSLPPIELSPALTPAARTTAAASHTGSVHRVRAHHHRHHHARHVAQASAGLQASRGSSPSRPGPAHRSERRAALPHVTRDHRPSPQGRSNGRSLGATSEAGFVFSVSIRGLRALEHDCFGNFAGDRGAGRGPPRASPFESSFRVSRPASAGVDSDLPTPPAPHPLHTISRSHAAASGESVPAAGSPRFVSWFHTGSPCAPPLPIARRARRQAYTPLSVGGLT